MMIECETVVQMHTRYLAYVAFDKNSIRSLV